MEVKNLDRPNLYDLIVIGGGPSGSLTAYHATLLGYRVLVLEKHFFPRVKPCGGGLTLRALRYLPFSINPLVKHYDHRATFTVNKSLEITCVAPEIFSVQIIRSEFDTFLLKQAQEVGSQVRTEEVIGIEVGEPFTVITTVGTYQSRYLVAADGSNGNSRRLLGIIKQGKRGRTGAALEGDIPQKYLRKMPKMEFYFHKYRSSYGWAFPKGDHINVGIFTYDGKKLKLSHRALQDLVTKHILPKQEVKKVLHNIRGYPLNFDYRIISPHPNLIFVGDAAGFPEPLWGEGLHHALKSAYLVGVALRKLRKEKKKIKTLFSHCSSLRDIYYNLCREIIIDLNFCHYLADGFNQKPHWGKFFIHFPFLKWGFTQLLASGRPTYHILSRLYSLPFWSQLRPKTMKAIKR